MPDVLQQWLLNIATRPPQEWHGYDRLALADYLEERGDPRAAEVRANPERDRLAAAYCEQLQHDCATGRISNRTFGVFMDRLGREPDVFRVLDWTPDMAGRERRRLLRLFPDVALEGPCPDHRGLPEGVAAVYQGPRGRQGVLPPGYCFTCGGSGVRTGPAPGWLPAGVFAGVLSGQACDYNGPAGSLTVRVPAGRPPVTIPADAHGSPIVVPPSLTPDGRPVCPAPPG